MKKIPSLAHAAAVSAAIALLPTLAYATDYYWNTTGTGIWQTGANWSTNPTSGGATGVAPSSGADSAFFNQSSVNGHVTVQFNDDATISALNFSNTATTVLQSESATPHLLTFISATVNSGAGAVTIGDATNILNVGFNQTTTTFNLEGNNGLTFANTVTQTGSASNVTLTANGVGNTVTFGNYNISNGGSVKNLTINGTGNLSISGTFANNSASGDSQVLYQGTGTLSISGTSTYTGKTTIGSGATASKVQFAKQVSLYNNGSALAWSTSAFRVNAGATMAFNVGGTGEFTSADIGTLSALNSATGGFTNGAILGLDTTNAGGGVFTLSNAIGLNRAAQGLIKLGSGTLDLAAPAGNTISTTTAGTTTVAAGKLRISNTSGSATGITSVLVNGGATTSLEGLGYSTGALTVTNGSHIAPGLNTAGANSNFGSAGTIHVGTTGGATFSNAHFDFDLSNSALGSNDLISTGGALSMGTVASWTFNELDGSLQTGVAYTLIYGASSANTGVDTVGWLTTFLGGQNYDAIYSFGGNDLLVTFAASAVPEPSTFTILAGLIALGFAATRRRHV